MLAALGKDFKEQQSRLIEADASVAEMTSTAGEMQALLSWLTAAHAEESAARQAFEHQVLFPTSANLQSSRQALAFKCKQNLCGAGFTMIQGPVDRSWKHLQGKISCRAQAKEIFQRGTFI